MVDSKNAQRSAPPGSNVITRGNKNTPLNDNAFVNTGVNQLHWYVSIVGGETLEDLVGFVEGYKTIIKSIPQPNY